MSCVQLWRHQHAKHHRITFHMNLPSFQRFNLDLSKLSGCLRTEHDALLTKIRESILSAARFTGSYHGYSALSATSPAYSASSTRKASMRHISIHATMLAYGRGAVYHTWVWTEHLKCSLENFVAFEYNYTLAISGLWTSGHLLPRRRSTEHS
jgi:hypothetical protein